MKFQRMQRGLEDGAWNVPEQSNVIIIEDPIHSLFIVLKYPPFTEHLRSPPATIRSIPISL